MSRRDALTAKIPPQTQSLILPQRARLVTPGGHYLIAEFHRYGVVFLPSLVGHDFAVEKRQGIIAVVGKTRGAGQLDIIASEQEKNSESVRYGIIKNPEETSMRIARIIERLERKPSVAPREIIRSKVALMLFPIVPFGDAVSIFPTT